MFYHQQHHHNNHHTSEAPSSSSQSSPQSNESDNSITLYISHSSGSQSSASSEHLFNIDIYSTIINAYLVFSNIKFKIKVMEPSSILSSLYSNHISSNDIHFPILVHSYQDQQSVIYGMIEILNYLKGKGENLDANLLLNENQSTSLQQIQTEIEAFVNIVHEKCLPFYLYWFWANDEVFGETTKKLYFDKLSMMIRWVRSYSDRSKHVQLMKNLISSKKMKKSSSSGGSSGGLEEVMNSLGLGSDGEDDDKRICVRLLIECLDSLSMLLGGSGNNKYFYGQYPSSLDTIVYGYLSCIYYSSPSHQSNSSNQQQQSNNDLIGKIFNRYPNLKRWLATVHDEYMYESNQYFIQSGMLSGGSAGSGGSSKSSIIDSSMVHTITPSQNQHLNNTKSRSSSSHQLMVGPALPNKRRYLTIVVVSIIGYLFYLLRNVRIIVERPSSSNAVPPKPEIYYYDNQYDQLLKK